MSAWFERQKEKDKNFRAQQLDAFEKHRGQLQLEVLEKRSEYREFPTEKNRKYIETREREIEEELQRGNQRPLQDACRYVHILRRCRAQLVCGIQKRKRQGPQGPDHAWRCLIC